MWVERLDGDEAFRGALRAKLIEEAREAAEAPDAELPTELADLLEVVDAIVEAYGLTSETVRALQQERRAERGGFTKRVRLLWTSDSPE